MACARAHTHICVAVGEGWEMLRIPGLESGEDLIVTFCLFSPLSYFPHFLHFPASHIFPWRETGRQETGGSLSCPFPSSCPISWMVRTRSPRAMPSCATSLASTICVSGAQLARETRLVAHLGVDNQG